MADEQQINNTAPSDQNDSERKSEPNPGKTAGGPALVWMNVGVLLLTVAMTVALFLPWAYQHSVGQAISQYGAPQPAIAAWLLLAVGLATVMVTLASRTFGARMPWVMLTGGSLLYLLGAGLWWAASILPTVVASGCQSNPGTLCTSPAASPTLSETVGPGFLLAVAASILVLLASLMAPRILLIVREPEGTGAAGG